MLDTVAIALGITGGKIVIDKDLTIEGLGADALTVIGGGNSRVFNITSGATVTNNITIADGGASGITPPGGGIHNAGTLTPTDCIMTGNSVPSGSFLGPAALSSMPAPAPAR